MGQHALYHINSHMFETYWGPVYDILDDPLIIWSSSIKEPPCRDLVEEEEYTTL